MQRTEAIWQLTGGQGWPALADLAAALVLSSLIGLEREAGQKSAGLRTHALVGLGSALFVNVSRYGFGAGDPSRVAAQIVSGIGFIGGGLIFVRRDAVRGLTTTATIWLTCAVGMACAAGLGVVAVSCTAGYFLIIRGFPALVRRLAPALAAAPVSVALVYEIGHALLPRVLEACAASGFRIVDTATEHDRALCPPGGGPPETLMRLCLTLEGRSDIRALTTGLSGPAGIRSVAVRTEDSVPGPRGGT
ncbi:MgtC/SapB family protein [Streptomyces sp. NRRL B-24484]|uniref:MgtC/SapB family protein n=1 Tax=Streptomyces sp. NRRL B-24484 TaxID=1463833 RepID=UPI0006937882|nr:MgtC/SapB family protein [Streptomyces sp. NRRL B-24484]